MTVTKDDFPNVDPETAEVIVRRMNSERRDGSQVTRNNGSWEPPTISDEILQAESDYLKSHRY